MTLLWSPGSHLGFSLSPSPSSVVDGKQAASLSWAQYVAIAIVPMGLQRSNTVGAGETEHVWHRHPHVCISVAEVPVIVTVLHEQMVPKQLTDKEAL